ncbi:MAG: hypothetical protein ACR2PT_09475, partial [Endozoicomonas sp.]
MNRGIFSYLLARINSPQSLAGRVLLGAGASTDEALIKAASDGDCQIIPELLPNLSNTTEAIRQAIYTAMKAGQPEFIEQLHRLSDIHLEKDYYWQLVEWLREKDRSLTGLGTELLLCLFPFLSDEKRETLARDSFLCQSRLFQLKLALQYNPDKPDPVTAKAFKQTRQTIQKQIQLSESAEDLETMKLAIRFLMRFGDSEQLFLWFLNSSRCILLPETFHLQRVTEQESSVLCRALIRVQPFFINTDQQVFRELSIRFPQSIDLKVATLLSCGQQYSEEENKLAEKTYHQCLEKESFGDCMLLLPALSPSSASAKATSLADHTEVESEVYRSCLRFLSLKSCEDKVSQMMPTAGSVSDDPATAENKVMLLYQYIISLSHENEEQALGNYHKWVKALLRNKDYTTLNLFLKHSTNIGPNFLDFSEVEFAEYLEADTSPHTGTLAHLFTTVSRWRVSEDGLVHRMCKEAPLLMALCLLKRQTSGRLSNIHDDYKAKLAKEFKLSGHVEALLTMINPIRVPNVLQLMQEDPDLQEVVFDQDTIKKGAAAPCFSNLISATDFARENIGKGFACAILFVNKLYTKLTGSEEEEVIVYPGFYCKEQPRSCYQSMFELQMNKFCYGLSSHYFQQLTTQAKESRQPELIHVWLEALQGAPKKRLEWVFQQFFDAFEEVKDDL